MNGKSCFFIGHRDAPQELFPLLLAAIEKHILEYAVTEFIVGHYGSFDRMAAQAVQAAKKRHPHVRLILLLSYHPAEYPLKLPEGFDGSYYPWEDEAIPKRLAIIKANRHIVDHADHLIAYARYPGSNARKLLEYARLREKKGFIAVLNLAENTKGRP